MKGWLVLALVLVAAPVSAQGIGTKPYVFLIAGEAADLTTTLHSLHTHRGKEGNPIMGSLGTPGLVAMKISGAAFIAFAMRKIAGDGHPKIARTVGYVIGGALAGVSVHNGRVGR